MKNGCTSEEELDFFTFSWRQYNSLANITGNVKERLGICLGEAVAGMVFVSIGDARYNELSEENLLEEARQLIVKKRNKLVYRLKLSAMVQGGDEPVTSFETRLKPGRGNSRWSKANARIKLTIPTRWYWTT